ncbi:MAG: S1C family serine protease [Bacteroidales bacterium]|nr:S1C family serine protease [Bacteroidales bacterium]
MKNLIIIFLFLLSFSIGSHGEVVYVLTGENATYIISTHSLYNYRKNYTNKILLSSSSSDEKELKQITRDIYVPYDETMALIALKHGVKLNLPDKIFFYAYEAIQDTGNVTIKNITFKGKRGKYVPVTEYSIFSGKPKPMLSKICENEDSLKNFIEQSKMKHKGIYECLPTDTLLDASRRGYGVSIIGHYRLAFIQKEEKYLLVNHSAYFDSTNPNIPNPEWGCGEIKASLRKSADESVYIGEWYDYFGVPYSCLVYFEGATMKVKIGDKECVFVKMDEGTGTSQSANAQLSSDTRLKSTGSGFIISGNVVATNYHVIGNAEKIKVVLNVNNVMEEFDAKVLATDKTNDLALLTIKDPKFKPLPSAPYSIEQSIKEVGSSVFTMGYPLAEVLGEEVKITDGIISSKTGFQGDIVTYQISAPIQPGNSGGALFDKKGHLVGITNAGINSDAADNVGYAIKSPYLLNLIDAAPIDIELPKGSDLSGKELPTIIKAFKPYVAFIKIYE